MPVQAAPAQTTNLFLLEDLEDAGRTSELADGGAAAVLELRSDWKFFLDDEALAEERRRLPWRTLRE